MNGVKGLNLLLDTNAVLYFLKGDARAVRMVSEADTLGVSFITVIELLSYAGQPAEKSSIEKLLCLFDVYYPNIETTPIVIEIRKSTGLKIPDSIIAAQSVQYGLTLATFDKELINKCRHRVSVYPL
jgi:predicted nucleic acid-binding protein